MLDVLAAELYAVAVFLCDGPLQIKPALASAATHTPATHTPAPRTPAAAAIRKLAIAATRNHLASTATRFFKIAAKLPMELQMMLCHHVVGSTKQNIHKDSETAFKSLASILLDS